MIRDLIIKTRSYRRFDPQGTIDLSALRELVDLARLSASGGNLQPLKYFLACDDKTNGLIYRHLAWAGYFTDWPGPAPDQRPTGYIVILCDKRISSSPGCDHGIAAQSIMLGATERGLAGCIIGSIKRPELAAALNLADPFDICLVLALGKPAESVTLHEVGPDGSIKYYRDSDENHHVPKRSLDDVILS